MRKPRTKFIVCRWFDHHESDAAWDTPGAEPEPAKFESRGWLIYEDENIIELSNCKPLNDAGGKDVWGRPLRLVKAVIYYRSDYAKAAKKVVSAIIEAGKKTDEAIG